MNIDFGNQFLKLLRLLMFVLDYVSYALWLLINLVNTKPAAGVCGRVLDPDFDNFWNFGWLVDHNHFRVIDQLIYVLLTSRSLFKSFITKYTSPSRPFLWGYAAKANYRWSKTFFSSSLRQFLLNFFVEYWTKYPISYWKKKK